jgi:hypothetical protein
MKIFFSEVFGRANNGTPQILIGGNNPFPSSPGMCPLSRDKRKREYEMHRQRGFVLLAMVAVAAVAPSLMASAQAINPAGGGARSAASIPDFSGVWAKPYVGIESPRSGPGPVTNRSRRNGARNVYQYVGDNAPVYRR